MTRRPIEQTPTRPSAATPRNGWVLSLQALTAAGAAALVGCTGGSGADVHHRLYASDYKRVDGGTVYVVLRYGGTWTDANHSQRIGLIKFETDPEPAVVESRWVWGKPANEQTYVCFDALRNRVVRRTDYVRRLELPGDRDERPVLAFADPSGRVEVVTPRGQVVVPAAGGYTDATLARGEGAPRLELARAGRWDRFTLDGEHLASPAGPAAGEVLTQLDGWPAGR